MLSAVFPKAKTHKDIAVKMTMNMALWQDVDPIIHPRHHDLSLSPGNDHLSMLPFDVHLLLTAGIGSTFLSGCEHGSNSSLFFHYGPVSGIAAPFLVSACWCACDSRRPLNVRLDSAVPIDFTAVFVAPPPDRANDSPLSPAINIRGPQCAADEASIWHKTNKKPQLNGLGLNV